MEHCNLWQQRDETYFEIYKSQPYLSSYQSKHLNQTYHCCNDFESHHPSVGGLYNREFDLYMQNVRFCILSKYYSNRPQVGTTIAAQDTGDQLPSPEATPSHDTNRPLGYIQPPSDVKQPSADSLPAPPPDCTKTPTFRPLGYIQPPPSSLQPSVGSLPGFQPGSMPSEDTKTSTYRSLGYIQSPPIQIQPSAGSLPGLQPGIIPPEDTNMTPTNRPLGYNQSPSAGYIASSLLFAITAPNSFRPLGFISPNPPSMQLPLSPVAIAIISMVNPSAWATIPQQSGTLTIPNSSQYTETQLRQPAADWPTPAADLWTPPQTTSPIIATNDLSTVTENIRATSNLSTPTRNDNI